MIRLERADVRMVKSMYNFRSSDMVSVEELKIEKHEEMFAGQKTVMI